MIESNPDHIPAIRKDLPKFQKRAKKIIQDNALESSHQQARKLPQQGELARLLEEEENNLEWQSMIGSLPRGLQGWAGRAATNSLPTPDNLAKWKKMVSKTCPLCGISPCTLFHLLNNCQTSVNQDRYNYRHDSILSYIYSMLRKTKD